MLVGVYSGFSPTSLVIRGLTMSAFSHAAFVDEATGRTFEAWHNPGYFREVDHPWDKHTRGTKIRFLRHKRMTPEASAVILAQCEEWARLRIRYDYAMAIRFLLRIPRIGPVDRRLFCSEAVSIAFRKAGLMLQNADDSLIAPHHIAWCPEMEEISPLLSEWNFGNLALA